MSWRVCAAEWTVIYASYHAADLEAHLLTPKWQGIEDWVFVIIIVSAH